jgi:hypothetical protein
MNEGAFTDKFKKNRKVFIISLSYINEDKKDNTFNPGLKVLSEKKQIKNHTCQKGRCYEKENNNRHIGFHASYVRRSWCSGI